MLQCSRQIGGRNTIFACDVIVTSFDITFTLNFNISSTIYLGVCVPGFALLRVAKYCEEENGGKNMRFQQHWRVARRFSGRQVKVIFVIYFLNVNRAVESLIVYFS